MASSEMVKNDYYSDLIANATKPQNGEAGRTATKELDRDAFLQLLVAEMSNQDPLNPMQDSDFIAQLAQFSTLEQMESMNSSVMQSHGMSLVGKSIIASADDGTNNYINGVVDSVIYNSGKTYLNVGGAIVSIENVKEIFETAAQVDTDTETDSENKE